MGRKGAIMKQEYLRQPATIRVKSSFLKSEKFFKITQLEYCKQRIEMVNDKGEVISDFPLIWNGLTFDEAKERIFDYARSVRAEEMEHL